MRNYARRLIGIFFLTLMLVSCKTQNTKKAIDETILKKLEITSLLLPDNNSLFSYQEKRKTIEISNVVSSGFNKSGYFYAFLSTENEKKQILIVVNKEKSIFKWIDFYPETSHFYKEKLIAFVITPFPERHLEEEITIIDFENNKEVTKIDSSKRSIDTMKLQDLYYMTPSFSQDEEGSELNIFWEQAHYPMSRMRCFLDPLFVGFSSNDEDYSILELVPAVSVLDAQVNELQKKYSVVCSQKIGDLIIAITVNSKESQEWMDYDIVIVSDSNEINTISLASVFRYQDPLLSITSGIPVDNRAAFIIETAEFSYDFYFNPISGESDSFLRPSSFTTRWVH